MYDDKKYKELSALGICNLKTMNFIEDTELLCKDYWKEDYFFEIKKARIRGYRGGFKIEITFDHEDYKY